MQPKRSFRYSILRGRTRILAGLLAFCAIVFTCGAQAETIRIVALGASNTAGMRVEAGAAWPAQLEAMLRAKGYDAQVSNAGVNGDTTAGMLARLDSATPQGTQLVILNPANRNDARVGAKSQQSAYVSEIRSRLQARNVKLIVLPSLITIAPSGQAGDGEHFTAQGHARVATYVLPQVLAAIGPPRR